MLQEQIENIIFQSLDETEKMGVSNFKELENAVLKSCRDDKKQITKNIQDINGLLETFRKTISELPSKKARAEEDKKQLEKLRSTLPNLPEEDIRGQEELARLYDQKKIFENQIISLKGKLVKIVNIRSQVKSFRQQISSFENSIIKESELVGITDLNIFKVDMKSDLIEAHLNTRESEINSLIVSLQSGNKQSNASILKLPDKQFLGENLQSVQIEIDKKTKVTKAFETEKIRYQKQKETIFLLEVTINAMQMEIRRVEEEIVPRIGQLENERLEEYIKYFRLLAQEKNEIEKLYQPLQKTLLQGTDTDKRLKFEARYLYALEQHFKRGLQIIDRTRKGNFRDGEVLKEALKNLWLNFSRSGFEDDKIKDEIKKLFSMFVTSSDGGFLDIRDQIKEGFSVEDFDNWIFDLNTFSVASSITFDGTDLHLLSPGQKGIVLLMLYLEIDKNDTRPLLIDQPEDNLDSLSVYNDLIDFFRDRKRYRQIIVVTHNSNLVVNTDADQVIVANYLGSRNPRLQYVSGALEDQIKTDSSLSVEELPDGIIEHVCNILEGGDIAIDKRMDKYKISEKNFKYRPQF
jgi:hypothetical protein